MTNAEKFTEVFEKEPPVGNRPFLCRFGACDNCKYAERTRTQYTITTRCHILDWWNEEYKGSRHNPAKDIISPSLPLKNIPG